MAGAKQGLAARSDGAEDEKSAGMVGAAPLVFGSKGAAEQTRTWETALLARWAVSQRCPAASPSELNSIFTARLQKLA